jgi:predicted permease
MTIERLLDIVRLRWRSLVHPQAVDRELDEELRFHLDQQIDTNLKKGMTLAEAKTHALRAIGGVELRKEQCRDERRVSLVENLARDVRMAFRQLRKQPVFTGAAIISLALGIGANTAIFQLLNAVSFRPLPVGQPNELVEVRLEGNGRAGRHTGRNRQWSQPQWLELQRRQQAFQSMLAFSDTRFNLSTSGEVRYVEGLWVSGSFFETLHVRPAVGRLVTPADDHGRCGYPAAVISHALWQQEFGGRADIVGQSIPFAGERVPIVGVTPPAFFGVEVGRRFDVAMPICSTGFERRDHWWLAAIGRLAPGWTIDQAQAHLQGLIASIQHATMPSVFNAAQIEAYASMRVRVIPAAGGVSPLRQSYRQPLWTLLAIAALVLLIAAVNLANLLLARATVREQEFAVRLAIGGSRGRVLQQVFTESVVLALLGSIAAVGVAFVMSRSMLQLISTTIDPIYLDLSIDWRYFGFTTAVAATTALIFGMAPALRAARARALRPGNRDTTASRAALNVRRGLVSLQVAITLVLLFGALLFVRSFRNIATQDLGVKQDDVVIANVFFPSASFPPEKRPLAYADLEDRLRALPGVKNVTDAFTTPIGGSFSDAEIKVNGERKGASYVNSVGAGYFDALGTPLVAGRDFDARDTPNAPRVAIVNELFAQKFLGPQPLGQRFATSNAPGTPDSVYEVIGVVKNQKYILIREPFPPIFYPASSQQQPGLIRRYVVRSNEPAARSIAQIGGLLNGVDPAISVRYSRLSTQVTEAMLLERLMSRLAAIFGSVALLLAMVGLFGMVSYGVASRRSEIGVRVALGATRQQVLRLILRDVGRVVTIGLLTGAVIAWLTARVIRSLLYEIEPSDAATMGFAIVVLSLAAFVAAGWPARQAAGIHPASVLRE